jgi:hypothetical protein
MRDVAQFAIRLFERDCPLLQLLNQMGHALVVRLLAVDLIRSGCNFLRHEGWIVPAKLYCFTCARTAIGSVNAI